MVIHDVHVVRIFATPPNLDRVRERISLHRHSTRLADDFHEFTPTAMRGLKERLSQIALVTAKRLRVVGLPRRLNIR